MRYMGRGRYSLMRESWQCWNIGFELLAAGLMVTGILAVGILDAGLLAAGILAAVILAAGILAAGILAAGILSAGLLAAGILAQREIYVHHASLRYAVRSSRILVMSFGADDFVQPKA
jgi:hypothetical protein